MADKAGDWPDLVSSLERYLNWDLPMGLFKRSSILPQDSGCSRSVVSSGGNKTLLTTWTTDPQRSTSAIWIFAEIFPFSCGKQETSPLVFPAWNTGSLMLGKVWQAKALTARTASSQELPQQPHFPMHYKLGCTSKSCTQTFFHVVNMQHLHCFHVVASQFCLKNTLLINEREWSDIRKEPKEHFLTTNQEFFLLENLTDRSPDVVSELPLFFAADE